VVRTAHDVHRGPTTDKSMSRVAWNFGDDPR
jgi:hypothetical protein